MPVLSETQIRDLLEPYCFPLSSPLLAQLSGYLDLLVRWNTRTNLTAVRSPEEMVSRHFGESLFAGGLLGDETPDTLLDLGSGAGFPGIPIALLQPSIAVTLAESQNKKAAFLREVVRTLELRNAEVWAARAETLPAGRMFHTVTLRAVDNMASAVVASAQLAQKQILLIATEVPTLPDGFEVVSQVAVPHSDRGQAFRAMRT
ncbi:16S rRNA (guanine(527)-N(7))-methyltransferase RsmG [Edaphobacter sp. HDX4]|uniref:16S rRNA (guanine(527)-N(7))-methyltransferase RsmG n=1 Tax=Edaphobacter sp. HDX4 TaxID=2794064 RepID=UPI002FE64BAF